MRMKDIMNAATMGDRKQLRPMILWTILEYLFRGAPYGILLMVIWELFYPLQHPGTPVDLFALGTYSVFLLISLVLLYFISKTSYKHVYYKSYDLCAEGRLAVADHLRKLSMGFYNSKDPGDIGSYLISDYANVEFILSHLIPQMIGAIVMPLFLLVVLASQSWQLALLSASVIPLAVPFTYISRAVINYFGKKHIHAKIDASSRMLEYLQGMRLIKAFNLTGEKFDRLEKSFRRLKQLSIKLEAGAGPTILFSSFILNSGLTLIILFGLTFLLSGTVSLPVYVMFLILGSRVYEPLMQVLTYMGELNYYQQGIERLNDLKSTKALKQRQEGAPPVSHDIAFNDVRFRYHDTNVLDGVSLQIPERSLVALVGPSGSGKTTMTRLIARFWDVNSGSISLGGVDIRDMDPDLLLSKVSMVFQDVYLFNDTILNNIRVANRNASMEQVIEAARQARCHEFIDRLPEGYETMVGEGGCTLSGGEKQRISIARAILKDAPIILLDEATASLDPENELYIQEAIDRLVQEKTVVVIAHRLNTVVHADTIAVLDEGKIAESGRHDELMQANGLYRRMWDEQQQVRGYKFAS